MLQLSELLHFLVERDDLDLDVRLPASEFLLNFLEFDFLEADTLQFLLACLVVLLEVGDLLLVHAVVETKLLQFKSQSAFFEAGLFGVLLVAVLRVL